eukprot:CAMPEP_0185618506 /NCGR_PEP_ID=MMETSP0436-20130131/47221_1 /TAXON_ID=626734 ORGANISM="Favella taraikaensis, Strain Fe Narragansett Bay" /NCGR_SAMPLE_ID=MMETSP0436 /ASSEMBLY_ACC=CAM_ASM_000390 /LENGTH=66 /DNA_ID=CAMNT_0028257159 /DNA_START=666 /DNA_END=866 /DNA_ORIENTATION=+
MKPKTLKLRQQAEMEKKPFVSNLPNARIFYDEDVVHNPKHQHLSPLQVPHAKQKAANQRYHLETSI